EEGGKWRIHTVRSLSEPLEATTAESATPRRAVASVAKVSTPSPLVTILGFLLAAAGFAGAFLLRARRPPALGSAAGRGLGGALAILGHRAPKAPPAPHFNPPPAVRAPGQATDPSSLSSLLPLRQKLEAGEEKDLGALARSLPASGAAADVSRLWIAQKA